MYTFLEKGHKYPKLSKLGHLFFVKDFINTNMAKRLPAFYKVEEK